jgi:hypothetical protein
MIFNFKTLKNIQAGRGGILELLSNTGRTQRGRYTISTIANNLPQLFRQYNRLVVALLELIPSFYSDH